MFYRHTGLKTYDFLFEYVDFEGVPRRLLCEGSETNCHSCNSLFGPTWLGMKTGEGKRLSDILLEEAESRNDRQLATEVRLLKRIATKEECEYLSGLFGIRILPSLPEEFDKTYYVKAESGFCRTLDDSGYLVFHTPYFAMPGRTHLVWEIDPHCKTGRDSAPRGTYKDALAPEDYLRLMEEHSGIKDEIAEGDEIERNNL